MKTRPNLDLKVEDNQNLSQSPPGGNITDVKPAAKVDEEAFKDFKYELDGNDYSKERCEELERAYWKTLTYAPPLYGRRYAWYSVRR